MGGDRLNRLGKPFRAYLGIATSVLVLLTSASPANAQENRKKPASRPAVARQMSPADRELARLRADVIQKMKESRASAEKLLALHEEEKTRLNNDYQLRRELYNQGLISRAELNQTERALAAVIVRVEEDKRWISESDITITEATTRDALLELPALALGGYSESGRFIRFNGGFPWSLTDAPKIEKFFSQAFGHALPISAFGQTATHDRLRFDHRNAMDVALHPDSKEGRSLLAYLRQAGIPFIAFRSPVAGASTGAHIHIGNPSVRTIATANSRVDCCKP
jgi:hypothetical protein